MHFAYQSWVFLELIWGIQFIISQMVPIATIASHNHQLDIKKNYQELVSVSITYYEFLISLALSQTASRHGQ